MINEVNLLSKYYILQQFGGKSVKKWSTLVHNGPMFVPLYVPHNIPLLYEGREVYLPPLAEEYATAYARYINTDYFKNKVFHKNFFNSWKSSIKGLLISSLDKCDFSKIAKYLEKEKEKKALLSPEKKQLLKDEALLEEEKYKVAIVDGKEQPTGNFKLEPPGIFIGRGNHPKIGTIKTRIMPSDVTINISKGVPIPVLPDFYKGHKYKKIIHDNTSEWLASWKDDITGKTKYVWLGNKSEMKAKGDMEKFDKARQLAKHINKIRNENNKNLVSKDLLTRQLATALYFIDNFALRVGNEKNEDEADTVGVTSLRIEHVTLLENNIIKLEFLGKDSIKYNNKVHVINEVYENISNFVSGKGKTDDLFNLINSSELNKYIKNFGHDFTARNFRTVNACLVFQKELDKINEKYKNYTKSDKLTMLLSEYNSANAKVAVLCNHQKNVSKGYEDGVQKLKSKMLEYKKKIDELIEKDSKKNKSKIEKLKDQIKKYKLKKESKTELKNISLGTSKMNYIDPRITVSFLKLHQIPVEKVFSKALQEKFWWAFDNVNEDWKF